jgi:hypothetical protein
MWAVSDLDTNKKSPYIHFLHNFEILKSLNYETTKKMGT